MMTSSLSGHEPWSPNIVEPTDAYQTEWPVSGWSDWTPGRTKQLQNPTPPPSTSADGNEDHGKSELMSVSTSFHPGVDNGPSRPDLILISSDHVYFYVSSHILLAASENAFKSLLPAALTRSSLERLLAVPESSTVLNVVLHTINDMSCAHYAPTFEDLCLAVASLQKYGIPLNKYIAPSTPLFNILLYHAPLRSMETYALAAQYDLYALAASASSHLLAFPLATLTDQMAERIGPLYLKRLFVLHLNRMNSLKHLLLQPPHPHSPTRDCDFSEQKKLTRAWALASAYLAWDATPDMPTSTIETALNSLGEHLTCDLCRTTLKDKTKDIVVQWTMLPRTI
ncbi:hypothetical protein PLICRDRAFT_409753 [Plicaturopsis crispa FD-325 SS-3]|nr:hypothetical protein PLICRDRAFT_409753 [Plicaturopsis crispa FD-325 SS-3]